MDNGQNKKDSLLTKSGSLGNFVLNKDIFSNLFDKDIRRVYIYKKAERLAKALHMIAPAFAATPAFKERIDRTAMALVDAALEPPVVARAALSHELLALSSLLSVARAGSLLSAMNADLIAHESQLLLQEVALYEEPRVFFDDSPTLAGIARGAAQAPSTKHQAPNKKLKSSAYSLERSGKGHVSDIKDTPRNESRREAVLAVVREKGQVYIKDISTVIRNVSEKTVQRELQALVREGVLAKRGERRWTLYSIA